MQEFQKKESVHYTTYPIGPDLCSVGLPKMVLGRGPDNFRGEAFPFPREHENEGRDLESNDRLNNTIREMLDVYHAKAERIVQNDPNLRGGKVTVWSEVPRVYPSGAVVVQHYLAVNSFPAVLFDFRQGTSGGMIELFHHGLVGTSLKFYPYDPSMTEHCEVESLFSKDSLREAHVHYVDKFKGRGLVADNVLENTWRQRSTPGAFIPQRTLLGSARGSSLYGMLHLQAIIDHASQNTLTGLPEGTNFITTCAIETAYPLKKLGEEEIGRNLQSEEYSLVTASLKFDITPPAEMPEFSPHSRIFQERYVLTVRLDKNGRILVQAAK